MTEGFAVGQVLAGKYRVERLLGAGGMGYVLLVSHLELHQRVALKLLHRELGDVPEALSRFMQEGRTAARLRSEHVGKVLDVGRLPSGEAYLVMEFLEGHDLAEEIVVHGPAPIETAVNYVLQACEAVAEAHAHGIVHRDLKPANLFLARTAYGEHRVKVLDFGISKIRSDANFAVSSPALTGSHTIMGSPAYMAPEQMRASRDVDGRTDIWALGTILYELVAGCAAFNGDTLAVVCSAVLNDAPPSLSDLRPNLPPGLESIILRCLEKQPNRRYGTVLELVQALEPFGPENRRDVIERIGRLVCDVAPEQAQAIAAARAALQSTPPGQLPDERNIPPTLSMVHQPVSNGGVKVLNTGPRINLQGTTAPGTGVVWSGTDLGISSRPKAGRSLIIGAVAVVALALGIFLVFRPRGAAGLAIPSANARAANSAERGSGPVAAARLVESTPAAPAASDRSATAEQGTDKSNQASAAVPSVEARKRTVGPKGTTAASASAAAKSPASAAALAPQQAPARAPDPATARPDLPKAEPLAPNRSSRVTDYGGRE